MGTGEGWSRPHFRDDERVSASRDCRRCTSLHPVASPSPRSAARSLAPLRLYTFQANHGAMRFYERHDFLAIAFTDGQANEERCPDVLYEHRASSSCT